MSKSVWYDNEGGKEITKNTEVKKYGSFQLYIINIYYRVVQEKVKKGQKGKTKEVLEEGVLKLQSYADREFPLDVTIKTVKPSEDKLLIERVSQLIEKDETEKRKIEIIKIERLEKRGLTAY